MARSRRGAVGILFALAMPVLIGFASIGTEVVMWYAERRELQIAADAAAFAAALEIFAARSTWEEAAEEEARNNGFDVGSVTVNVPPEGGSEAGSTDAAEVVLEVEKPTLLSGLFIGPTVTVSARAVASVVASPTLACVLALDGQINGAVTLQGKADLAVTGCLVAANSTSPSAIVIGGTANLIAQSLYTPGSYTVSGSGSMSLEQAPRTGARPYPDPYAGLAMPVASSCTVTGYRLNSKTPTVVLPGTYCSGMSFGAQAVVDFRPGTYVVRSGDFHVNGGAVLTCSLCTGTAGVTIIMTGSPASTTGSVVINGGAQVTLRAPRTGTYAGILFAQDPAAPSAGVNRFNGGATMSLEGALYTPAQEAEFAGNNSAAATPCLQVVARQVTFTGTSTFGGNCSDVPVRQVQVPDRVRLVE